MTKAVYFYLALLMTMPLLFSCGGSDEPLPAPGTETEESFVTIAGGAEYNVEADESVFSISFETSHTWVASAGSAWISVANKSGDKGRNSLQVTVKANGSYDGRSSWIFIQSGSTRDSVVVNQSERLDFMLGKEVFVCGPEGEIITVAFETNTDYEVQVDESCGWIHLETATKALEEGSFNLSVDPNGTLYEREGFVRIVSAPVTRQLKVRQSATAPVFEVNTSRRFVPWDGAVFHVDVTSNLELSVSTPDWITYTGSENGIDFSVGKNEAQSSRSGSIIISNAEFSKTAALDVSQKAEKSMYILAIGNSFSWDAMEYLAQILKEMGYTDVFLGNLYIGGCTLQTHASNVESGSAAYEYRTTVNGTWSSTGNYSSLVAMCNRDWDYVSVQQASGDSGIPGSYDPYLDTVMDAVKKWCPGAKRMWHMTWAYQNNSSHSDFPKYGRDQMTMYKAILNSVNTRVLSRGDFDLVIPCGTAVQNIRSSYLGDTVTRDGYHMSYNTGRLLTALMWAREITGRSIADVSYKPNYYYSGNHMAMIKESVENAHFNPYEITQASIPLPDPFLPSDEIKAQFIAAGYSLDAYEAMPLYLTHNAYYNSTGGSTLTWSDSGSTATNLAQFTATQIFGRHQIPSGSVIVLKPGFQYRPEGWTALTTNTASTSRPANVTDNIVVVDSAWWGSWNYRAFNIAKAGNPNLDDSGQKELESCFAIFVPKN